MRRRIGPFLAVLLLVLLPACESGTSGGEGEVADDATEAGDTARVDAAGDADATGADADDAGPELPDPSFVFEQLAHPACIPDEPYPAHRVELFRTAEQLPSLDVRAVVADGEAVWAGTADGLCRLGAGETAFAGVPITDAPDDSETVDALVLSSGGGVLAAIGAELYAVGEDLEASPVFTAGAPITRIFECGGALYLLAGGALSRSTGAAAATVEACAGEGVADAACAVDSVLIACPDGLWTAAASSSDPASGPVVASEGLAHVAGLGEAGAVLAATDDTLAEVRDGEVESMRTAGPDGLPAAGITAIAGAPGAERWAIGHTVGVTLLNPDTGEYAHLHSLRWLPGEQVTALSFAADGSLWVGTPTGIAHLRDEPQTLADKAEVMFESLERWHVRTSGYVTAWAHGIDPWAADPPAPTLWDDDNDGQWTEEAIGAFCYAWAVTGDERYYAAARRSVEGMFLLFDVPASDFEAAGLGYGFVSRSVVRDDEGSVFESKATQSNWHRVTYTDGHDYYWKDDTSSDEVTGHLYGLSIYYDLCARDAAERAEVAHYLTAMIGYILDHDYRLIDVDGEGTLHGYWDPEDLAIAVDGIEACCAARGTIDCVTRCVDAWGGGGFLNSLEILGGLVAAWHVSGEPRFLEAFESLIDDHRFDEVASFVDTVQTWVEPVAANYCDHELADLSFLALNRYEPDAERRALWTKSMSDAYVFEDGERNPLKSLSLAAVLTAADVPGLAGGIATLREYPTDLRDFRMDNSHRLDAEVIGSDRHGDPQFDRVFPYDEIPVVRWDSNPYRVAGGGDGSSRMTPTFWLLPYWGLRYHGAICPE